MLAIRRGPDAWYAKLSPADAALMGCVEVPLPLTNAVSEADAVRFARSTPMGKDGVVVFPYEVR